MRTHRTALALVVAVMVVWTPSGASAAVPSAGTWQHEAVDVGVDGADAAAGIAALVYRDQLHVFSDVAGDGLRHLWYDGEWKAETLDAGQSSGDFVTATVLGDQLQVFNATPSGWGVRHLWYDESWRAETLDVGRMSRGYSTVVWPGNGQLQLFAGDWSSGGIRHGWYDGQWNFETFDIVPRNPVKGVAAVTYNANGDLQVFTALAFSGAVRHGWYDGSWHFEQQPFVTSPPSGGAATTGQVAALDLGDQLHVFADNHANGFDHMWFDGVWHGEQLDLAASTGGGLSATVFDFNGQIQVFDERADGLGLRHGWYDGIWHFEDVPSDGDGTRTVATSLRGTLHALASRSPGGLSWLTYLGA